jgi:hypothetical protein
VTPGMPGSGPLIKCVLEGGSRVAEVQRSHARVCRAEPRRQQILKLVTAQLSLMLLVMLLLAAVLSWQGATACATPIAAQKWFINVSDFVYGHRSQVGCGSAPAAGRIASGMSRVTSGLAKIAHAYLLNRCTIWGSLPPGSGRSDHRLSPATTLPHSLRGKRQSRIARRASP